MKVAIFDAFNGAGGDMIIASMLDVGIRKSEIDEILSSINLKIDYRIEKADVKGIRARRIRVMERGRVKRSFEDVVSIIKSSGIDGEVKNDALKIFEILARAEGRVHGKDYRKAVFHEVGSDDAIFDVLCSAKAFRNLADKGYSFFAKPIRVGSGFIDFSHGRYPVPSPAVLEILKDAKIKILMEGEGELLTPTAAAILSYYCDDFPPFPMRIENVSYGAGSRETEVPNVLRLILGKVELHDSIAVIETNLDDVSGEYMGYAMENLIQVDGVLDVTTIPAFGKKGRPGFVMRIIANLDRAEEVAEEVMRQTGSLGVRIIPVYHRQIAEREEYRMKVKIRGEDFEVRFKRSLPEFRHMKPEFDDIAMIASRLDIPIHEVYRKVLRVLENADTEWK
ncbi:nickel pincer cofactor biosynthesis protein LarC [Archaeoglobus neptunius]|uniref:nickel pincer cofactor biosynthesis protein LarC n=1 Tax=Archaeoglobus neptunius TaxID=2798580 RepID=UPI0019284031|nr:nickel pincer cofactor biosynthesis protein LarC [Archaeoglobus neptunius]